MNSRGLALFDFDGTITKKDSLQEFVIFEKGKWLYYAGLVRLSPVLIRYKLGLVPNWRAKERLLTFFFRGASVVEFQRSCKEFALNYVPKIIRKNALEKINGYLEKGYRVIVVSASPENWVEVWASSVGLECIATRLEVKEGKLTGKIVGKNCHGPEKVDRIIKHIDISGFSDIHAFGDSRGDRQMLELATSKFYRPFR